MTFFEYCKLVVVVVTICTFVGVMAIAAAAIINVFQR